MQEILPGMFQWFAPIFAVAMLLKLFALWKAAKRRDWWWFVALVFINTLGILEILYIFIWNKRPIEVNSGSEGKLSND